VRQQITAQVRKAALRLALILVAIGVIAVAVNYSGLIGECYDGGGLRGGWRDVPCKR
jgi:hypothetical protein